MTQATPQRAAWTRTVEYVFLVGCPRSGTTWLQALLAAHPAIYSGPETHFFSAYAPVASDFQLDKRRRVGLSAYWSPESFHSSLDETFGALLSALPPPPPTARYFLEKSPQHAHHAALILQTIPRARFIHLVRDPRAVIASLLKIKRTWGARWAPQDVEAASSYWLGYYRAAQAIPSLVNSPQQFTQITFEALQRDPTRALGHLFRWLELDADAALLERAISSAALPVRLDKADLFPTIPPPPIADHNTQLYPADFVTPSAGRRTSLTRRQRRRIEYILGPTMRELGYDDFDPHFGFLDRTVAPPRVRRIWTRVRPNSKTVP